MILQGKDFNPGIRAFILTYEALCQLGFACFLLWLTDHNQLIPHDVMEQLLTVRDLLHSPVVPSSAVAELERLIAQHVMPLFAEYRKA